ncbi:MAG: NAD(P)/FAD-dependent oxidoreductase [SAR202 cluster bacterium]|nr:NAD(P)/FAD-dependent oxidoreductase [SAR202 cluster bacterium]
MNQNQYDAIIIGAGHNGLVTAGYLAKDGLSVLVLERLEKVGGACSTDEIFPGFNGPWCAYICYMLQGKVIDDLRLRDFGFEIMPLGGADQSSRGLHPFPDGTFLHGPGISSPFDAAQQIKEFSEHDARRYFDWLSFWEEAAGILLPYFLTEPPTLAQVMDDVRGTRREEVLEKMITSSMMDMVEEYFDDDRVRAAFLGIPESNPSATGSVMSNAYFKTTLLVRDQDRGIPKGSMGAVTQAMADSARSLGAEIRVGTAVEDVIVENGEAKGVRLVNGEEIRSYMVVSNADPKRTYTTLVKPEDVGESLVRKVENWKNQAGCVKFLAALKEAPDFSSYLGSDYDRDSIVTVNIAPSTEYFQQAWDDCKAGKITDSPLMHIQMPSIVDPSLTPRGGVMLSNWVLYYPPELADGTSWEDARNSVGERIIDVMTEYAPNFRESLIDWTVQTPVDIEERVGITDGNIRHGDVIPQQMLTNRFSYRTPIRNFYLCGAGTHPGGEVTGAPGHNAAHAILKDLARTAV